MRNYLAQSDEKKQQLGVEAGVLNHIGALHFFFLAKTINISLFTNTAISRRACIFVQRMPDF